jgi:quinol monooxygenase YgiN
MSVVVLLELQVKPEAVEALKGMFKQILPDTRAYDGCQGVDVYGNLDTSTNLVLHERWASRQHYERYLAWRTETGALTQLGQQLTAQPSIRYYEQVDA